MKGELISENERISTKKSEKEELNNLDPIWTWGNTRWTFVIILSLIHLEACKFMWIIASGQTTWKHVILQLGYGYLGGLGIVAGAHRLWSHKCYKAKNPLKIILIIFNSISGQTSVWRWCKDHRLHHKFSETNADPHNAKRGFFFSHVGWILVPEHKMVEKKFKTIDMSDLEQDPFVMFQYRNYGVLVTLFCFVFPTWFFHSCLGEDLWIAWSGTIWRFCISINAVFLINSWAHLWGSRPYDKTIGGVESKWLSILTFGEGWHNYHHTFPWDYKAAELGHYKYNFCTAFIDFFSTIGWAYELKTVPWKIVKNRIERTGDGSHQHSALKWNEENDKSGRDGGEWEREGDEGEGAPNNNYNSGPWGWGDEDIPQENVKITQFI